MNQHQFAAGMHLPLSEQKMTKLLRPRRRYSWVFGLCLLVAAVVAIAVAIARMA